MAYSRAGAARVFGWLESIPFPSPPTPRAAAVHTAENQNGRFSYALPLLSARTNPPTDGVREQSENEKGGGGPFT